MTSEVVVQERNKTMEIFFFGKQQWRFLQHWLAHMARWKVIHNMSQQQGEQ